MILHLQRFPVVLEKGEGVYLTDVEGKKYLDFGAGIAVFALGYHYQDYDEAPENQMLKLQSIPQTSITTMYRCSEGRETVVKASSLSGIFHKQRRPRPSEEPSRQQKICLE